MMAVGWMAFLGSWLMNGLFYKVHPSAVDCSKKGVREKLFIHVQGKKQFLWGYRDSKGYYTVSTYNLYFANLSNREHRKCFGGGILPGQTEERPLLLQRHRHQR